METVYNPFVKARPVWPQGMEHEMNVTCRLFGRFTATQSEELLLRVAGATIYRAFLNGHFFAHGPARCAHGFFRVDEWPLPTAFLREENELCIEVAGYNVNSFAYLDQPSFIQAELAGDGGVILYTGGDGGFAGGLDTTRVQKAERYSFQRAFTEAYALPTNAADATAPCMWAVQPDKTLVPRRVPLPALSAVTTRAIADTGHAVSANPPAPPYNNRATVQIGEAIKGFTTNNLDAFLTDEMRQYAFHSTSKIQAATALSLTENMYQVLCFGQNTTGFISIDVECADDTLLYLLFDERLNDSGHIDYTRTTSVNIIKYTLPRGKHTLLTMEPYVMRYLKIFCARGNLQASMPQLIEYKANLPLQPWPKLADKELETIYAAAVETLLQNSVDLFMDCPSRERAGWLCDSYFTARAEKQIAGENRIEENFLENYLLPESFPFLPQGILPMCYPADHNDGVFIPNWCMWLVLELEDYLARGGKLSLVQAFRGKVYGFLRYLEPFHNEQGLLEDLAGWVFLDWSRANDADVVCGVNFPTNMLYARMLEAVAALYDDAECAARAANLHTLIREMSFNGICFADNSTRQNGILTRTQNTTEACQNYAFFCGTATAESHPALWADFLKGFDAAQGLHNTYNLAPANAFIALYVRLAALAHANCTAEIEADVRRIFFPQAVLTGTLWENLPAEGHISFSMNHGFAAYAANLLAMVSA